MGILFAALLIECMLTANGCFQVFKSPVLSRFLARNHRMQENLVTLLPNILELLMYVRTSPSLFSKSVLIGVPTKM